FYYCFKIIVLRKISAFSLGKPSPLWSLITFNKAVTNCCILRSDIQVDQTGKVHNIVRGKRLLFDQKEMLPYTTVVHTSYELAIYWLLNLLNSLNSHLMRELELKGAFWRGLLPALAF
uniref:Uncharacterized protein n=1 Tax=Parascaris univalens TaxID=6257 RepID=A0A914ZVH7_PARUN